MTVDSKLVLRWEIDNAKARFATGKVESECCSLERFSRALVARAVSLIRRSSESALERNSRNERSSDPALERIGMNGIIELERVKVD
uniref:Uncharacterized protein n=1 Tax=Pristionchus pacificus TaxID=54126 RepID=A0A2A6BN81_PRIPA|eukprot:PDM67359.1 hypothetical protein PRIPAC_48776 [Pristionchus pacificus]